MDFFIFWKFSNLTTQNICFLQCKKYPPCSRDPSIREILYKLLNWLYEKMSISFCCVHLCCNTTRQGASGSSSADATGHLSHSFKLTEKFLTLSINGTCLRMHSHTKRMPIPIPGIMSSTVNATRSRLI